MYKDIVRVRNSEPGTERVYKTQDGKKTRRAEEEIRPL